MSRVLLLTAVVGLCANAVVRADEAEEKLKAQKKTAEANFALLDAGEPAQVETAHLLLFAPKDYEKKLKDLGPALEKAHDLAVKTLKVDAEKDKWWPGKLTVYVLPDRNQFTAFVRRVEKRRLDDAEFGGFRIDGDEPYAAAGPGKAKTDPSAEAQAAQQVASAVLQRKAGAKVPLPGWLLDGFGRATLYRGGATAAASADRASVKRSVAAGRTAKEIWNGGLTSDEALAMQGSLVEYLAYGAGSAAFEKLLSAYRPDEGQERKETSAAFAAAEIKPDELEKKWWAWAQTQR